MRLFEVTEIQGCPRTRATECSCQSVKQLSEAKEKVNAIAVLEHGDAKGMIKLSQEPGGPTIIEGNISKLTEGVHGLHIHEFGDLSDGCDSAGGHYNPDGVDHGDLEKGHVGDLGNVEAGKSGVAKFKIVAERVDLHGDRSVVGRAIVIHADEDDLGKGGDEESLKTGNAGDRVGCGVIRLAEKLEEDFERNLSDKHFDRNQLPQIRRKDIKKSDFDYKEGSISLDKLKPVQSQRVKGLSTKAQDVFLKNADRPFIIDRKGYIINGHHRYDAANMLGIDKVKAIMIDADIEDVMKEFAHTVSNTKVDEYGVPDYNTMPTYKLKKAHKGKQKFFLPSNEPTPKGVQAVEDVVGMNPQAKKPYFSPEEADRANDEWINQAQVDQEDGVIVKGTDGKQYRIMTSYNNEHFEDGEVYLDGLTDPTYIDTEGYPDAAELLYYHSATGHYPDDEQEVEENFADGKKKGKSRPGRVKRSGASCKGSVTSLRAKAKKYSGERGKMYHWCANMKSGKKKKNESLMVSTFDTEFVQKAKELYNAGQQGQLIRHIYKFSKENSEKIQARPDLKQMLQDIFYEVSDNFQDEEQIEELLFIIDDTLNKNVNESAFKNLKLPTWMSHSSLEKLFAQEYGPRYGEYVAYMDLDSDNDLAMNAGGEMSDMAFELAKVHDIKVMQDFLTQTPVQFTVDDLKLHKGVQVWHLVQQNKTVH